MYTVLHYKKKRDSHRLDSQLYDSFLAAFYAGEKFACLPSEGIEYFVVCGPADQGQPAVRVFKPNGATAIEIK